MKKNSTGKILNQGYFGIIVSGGKGTCY